MNKNHHVVFFDGKCGLCDQLVQWLLKRDTEEIFLFAPLQGKTADETLCHLPKQVKNADSMILIENYNTPDQKIHLFGKAALRTLWLLGGRWQALGWIHLIPAFFYDWIYWLIARNRRTFFGTIELPSKGGEGRFLP